MMGKHTAGPWGEEWGDDKAIYISAEHEGGRTVTMVASVLREQTTVDEVLANAHLIAAAPELLEAAQSLMGLLDTPLARRIYGEDGFYLAAIESGRTAIAKAKGES